MGDGADGAGDPGAVGDSGSVGDPGVGDAGVGDPGSGDGGGGGSFFTPVTQYLNPTTNQYDTYQDGEDWKKKPGIFNLGGYLYGYGQGGWSQLGQPTGGVAGAYAPQDHDLGGMHYTAYNPYGQTGSDQGSASYGMNANGNFSQNFGGNAATDLGFLTSIGYKPDGANGTYGGMINTQGNEGTTTSAVDPHFLQYLQDKDISLGMTTQNNKTYTRAFDDAHGGNPIGNTVVGSDDPGKEFGMAFLGLASPFVGPMMAAGLGGGAVGGAAAGGLMGAGGSAFMGAQGSDILKGAATGALGGGLGAGVNSLNPAGALGIDNNTLASVVNKGISGGLSGGISAGINGGNPLEGAAMGAAKPLVGAGLSAGVNAIMGDDNSGGDGSLMNRYDSGSGPLTMDNVMSQTPQGTGNYGGNPYVTGGPSQMFDQSMNPMGGLPQQRPAQTENNGQAQGGNPILDGFKKFATGMTTGNMGGINMNNMGAGLMDMYNRYKQNRDQGQLASNLSSMYGPNSAYAQQLSQALQRHDAASGRRSQVGARNVELQARLADMNSRNAPTLDRLYQQTSGNRNAMLNDAYKIGVGGPNGGGLLSGLGSMFSGVGGGSNLMGANPASDYNYQNGSDLGQPYANGGPVSNGEPVIGSKGPVRTGGGGGLSPDAVRAAVVRSAAPASSPNTYVNPINPRSVNDYREQVQGLARGGPVRGPGGPRTDSIPARLSNGEHVMDTASVNALGGGNNSLGQMRLNALRAHLKGQ